MGLAKKGGWLGVGCTVAPRLFTHCPYDKLDRVSIVDGGLQVVCLSAYDILDADRGLEHLLNIYIHTSLVYSRSGVGELCVP